MPAVAAIGVAGLISGASLAVAAVGTGYSIYAGQKSLKEQKKANQAEQARNDLQNARQKRDAIRQARMAYGSAQQSAENQGVSLSSSALGGQGSISSQLSSNLSFLDNYKFLTDQASEHLSNAASYKTNAAVAQDVAGLGFSAFNNSDRIAAVFKGK